MILDPIDSLVLGLTAWTPALASSGGGTPGYTLQSGYYVKSGNAVTVTGRIVLSGLGTLAAGSLTITGLPVATANIYVPGGFQVNGWSGLASGIIGLTFGMASNGTIVYIGKITAATVGPQSALDASDLTGGFDFSFWGTYLSAA